MSSDKKDSGDRLVPVNPAPHIKSLFGKRVLVKLKWGMEYHGTLSCADSYMNLQLRDVEEYVVGDAEQRSFMPKLLIRCNNILYISQLHEKPAPPAAKD